MAIHITCPACSAAVSLSDDSAGREATCPKCGAVIPAPAVDIDPLAGLTAPAPEPRTGSEPERSALPPRDEPARAGDAPARRVPYPDDDDDRPRRRERDRDELGGGRGRRSDRPGDDRERDRPARRRRPEDDTPDDSASGGSGGGTVITILVVVFGIFLVCCGGVGYLGYLAVKTTKEGLEHFKETIQEENLRQNEAKFHSLNPLMTKTEVEAILGPGMVANVGQIDEICKHLTPPNDALRKEELQKMQSEGRLMTWLLLDGYIFVAFTDKPDRGGKLQMKDLITRTGVSEHSGTANDVKFAKEHPNLGKEDQDVPRKGKLTRIPTDADKNGRINVTVSTGQLLDTFFKDKVAAEKLYKDKQLLVTGVVDRWENNYTAIIKSTDDKTKSLKLRVVFLADQEEDPANFKEGDEIKFRARYVSSSDDTIQLNRGWIVP